MIETLGSFVRFARPYRGRLVLGLVIVLAEAALGLAAPWPLKVIVDEVLIPGGGSPVALPFGIAVEPGVLLAGGVAAIITLAILNALTSYVTTVVLDGTGLRIGNDIRDAAFAHLQRLSLRFHGENPVGDLTVRLTGDVDRIGDLFISLLSSIVPNVIVVVSMLVVMVLLDPVLALLALSVSPLMALFVYRSTNRLKAASRTARRFTGDVAAAASESLAAVQVVQAFTLEEQVRTRFRDLNMASLQASLAAIRLSARATPVVDLAAAAATTIVVWFGAMRVLSGDLTVGTLLVFVSYVGSLYRPIKSLSKLGYVLSRGYAAAERVEAILRTEPRIADRPGAVAVGRAAGRVSFDGVGFSYGREPVLRDVTLSIDPGEVLALVGRTGAGKSTLASLIPRFHDPDTGVVRLDGTDLRDLTVASVRSQVALVLQDSILFRGTIWDNIACGRADATEADVERAIELALVGEFVDRLPDGAATVVGERGASLSGGQRQRIAIARAIVRDAPILILDEPTSALDPASEALVVGALQNLMRSRTTLLIAHRLSTVGRADRIAVLDGGRIVELGSPAELAAAGGPYSRMLAANEEVIDPEIAAARRPAERRGSDGATSGGADASFPATVTRGG